jgi:WhiB family redox-sensing transcriptional regulator
MNDHHRRPVQDRQTSTLHTSEERISVSSHAGVMDAEAFWDSTAAWQAAEQQDAAGLPCRQNPADLWFAELPEDVEMAKSLCGGCPIREQCLAGALERSEPWGVWGGQLVIQGTVVPRKRPRGRPRKNPVAA